VTVFKGRAYNLCIKISDFSMFLNLLKNSALSLALFKEKFYASLFKVGEKFSDSALYL
jgi:hypothetical protein